jgi:hypothetical protein
MFPSLDMKKHRKTPKMLMIAFLVMSIFVILGTKSAAAQTRTKTVEFFVGQDQTSGTGIAANTFWNPAAFTVDLPDAISSATVIKSAWVDYTFQSVATGNPGVVTLGLTPSGLSETTFASVAYTSSGENYSINVKGDFTTAVRAKIQNSGTASFAFRARVAGVARKMENAKMFITYEYDDSATTQLQTIKYRIGQNNGNVAVGAAGVTFTSLSFAVAENSPVVVSAWSEIKGRVIATGTTDNTFAVNYDSDSASNYYLDNAGGTDDQLINIMHNKPSITLNATHTLKVAATAGYQMNLLSAEQTITYKFNYADSTSLTRTAEFMLYSNGTRASATALNATTTINIPEDSPSVRNVYLRGTAHAVASSTLGLAARLGASAPTPSVAYAYTAATETQHNFWLLSGDINDLGSLVQGNNQISARFSGTVTSRSMTVCITYTFDKDSSVQNGSAIFFGKQQTTYNSADTASVPVAVSGIVQSGSYGSYVGANIITGVTTDRAANISVQPTATSTYNWDSNGEYQWAVFYHKNSGGEVSGSGTYTVNLNSTSNKVANCVLAVSWRYVLAGTINVSSTGSQVTSASIPSNNKYIGGAFTLNLDEGNSTVSSIMISETGTVSANTNLSDAKLYYETASTCNYDGTESQFGSAQNFNSSQQATFNGGVDIGTSQVCFYVVLDIGNGASGGQTVDVQVTNPSADITVSDGAVSPATPVAIAGSTTLIAGTLTVDMVDSGGNPVSNPAISFASKNFSWSVQQSDATLGNSSQRIRVNNTTGTATWTLSIAATAGTGALWNSGSNTYDFNGNSLTGRLQIDSSSSTITPQGGCSTTGLAKGGAVYFQQGIQDSINIIVAGSSTQTGCYWDVTGVDVLQEIPQAQPVGSYSIDMTLTVI